jgi:hypothetical protein
MRSVLTLAFLLVSAGCLADGPSESSPSASAAPEGVGNAVHRFQRCEELDFSRAVAYSRAGLGPFRPVPADPGGQTMNLLYTSMRCASANGTLTPVLQPTAIFTLLVVEPLKGHELAGAAGYQLLRSMTSANGEWNRDWASFGVQTANASVQLSFTDQPSAPKSRADMSVSSPLHTVAAQSVMAGTPSSGKAGILGLYTLKDDAPSVHRVDFGDYTYYSRGTAVLRPGLAGAPANAVPAYHNIGFDVTFTLNGTAPP